MSLMIDDKGQIRGTSKMVHIAQAVHFYEKDYYTPLEMFEWEIRVQAYQNNVMIAMCNRVGKASVSGIIAA